jgi:3-oxoacyl-[acyl-carrier protein] reductase
MNELNFSGRTVLVAGGSSGIGNGIAQAFRANGAEVNVWGTRSSSQEYAGEDGCDLNGLIYQKVDVKNEDEIARAASGFQILDVLVLCQGAVLYNRQEFKMPGFRKVIEVNLMSLMACADKFHTVLANSKGALIIVSSTAAFRSTRGNPGYNASKAGAVGLTRTLGEAFARDGIRVNGIAPGLVDTKLTKATTENPERLQASLSQIPLKRLGRPHEMAGVALFLASPLSSYVLGQTIIADGGLSLA